MERPRRAWISSSIITIRKLDDHKSGNYSEMLLALESLVLDACIGRRLMIEAAFSA